MGMCRYCGQKADLDTTDRWCVNYKSESPLKKLEILIQISGVDAFRNHRTSALVPGQAEIVATKLMPTARKSW
jgi:hypothetical protein